MNRPLLALAAILTTSLMVACGSGSESGSGQPGRPAPAPVPADTTPPTAPANVVATPISSAKVRLTWSASTDNVGVAGYRIYRDGALVGSTLELFFEDAGLAETTPYAYRVAAFDAAQNVSPPSGTVTATTAAAGGSDGGLLLAGDLEYVGAFRLPTGNYGCVSEHCTFAFGGSAISYNPQNNSLFMMGHRHGARIAEVNIPALVHSSNVAALNVATVRQNFADLALGQIERIGAGGAVVDNGVSPGGTLVSGSRLIVSASAYYDAAYDAVSTHFTANAHWGDGSPAAVNYSGMLRVAPDAPQAGFVAGYMGRIPERWQARLGGTALTGQATVPIITRTSLGPSVFSFNDAQVGVVQPTPASALVYYPSGHWTLGHYDTHNPNVNQSTGVNGVVFPEGTRSVLFFGRHGTGAPCYGPGTGNPALHGQPDGEGGAYCYDPTDASKGTHGYPYVYQVWAYDANDLVTVRNGQKQPWEALPYAVWTFTLPIQSPGRGIGGVGYDAATQTIYVSAVDAYQDDFAVRPLVHAFRVNPPSP